MEETTVLSLTTLNIHYQCEIDFITILPCMRNNNGNFHWLARGTISENCRLSMKYFQEFICIQSSSVNLKF